MSAPTSNTVPDWLRPLLRADEVAFFDPHAFNICRQELKGAWFGISDDHTGESDGRRYVARADGWPACPTCAEDELFVSGCLRCGAAAPAEVRAQMDRVLSARFQPGASK